MDGDVSIRDCVVATNLFNMFGTEFDKIDVQKSTWKMYHLSN